MRTATLACATAGAMLLAGCSKSQTDTGAAPTPAVEAANAAGAIPGAADDVEAAQNAGAVTEPITEAAGVTSALGKLGMSPQVSAQFIPVVTAYVGKVGGPQVGQLLSGLFP